MHLLTGFTVYFTIKLTTAYIFELNYWFKARHKQSCILFGPGSRKGFYHWTYLVI